jgi:RNA-directed DNA polymerase
VSRRPDTADTANGPGKVAPHTEAPGSGSGVKAAVVQVPGACVFGEPSIPGAPTARSGPTGTRRVEGGGGNRGPSSALARAPRPAPVGCDSPPEPRPATETLHGRVEGVEDSAGKHGGAQAALLEQSLSREYRRLAWHRVQANPGAAGMDGMTIQAFPEWARQPWERRRSALAAGTYRPAAVRRVMLPNASGGERPLGMPPMLDRVIQQAIAQVIGPLFEPHFSTDRDGVRPGRRARRALAAMEEAHREGLRDGADGDLKRFFATVHHGLLRHRLAKRLSDRRVWRLMGRDLRAGVIRPEGRREPTSGGVPQGGPLAPLLAHGRLDARAKEWERRGWRVARDADDFLLFVRSQRAATRVRHNSSRFIEGHLRRRVNPNKSQAARLSACSVLGFELRRATLPGTEAAGTRFQERVREMTNRSTGRHLTARLAALKRYVSGWLHDFGHSQR